MDDIKFNYGFLDFNLIVYDVFRQIAEKFIAENIEEISKILELKSPLELDEYMYKNDLYEIYTNYIDSHLWFHNEEIQELFENQKH